MLVRYPNVLLTIIATLAVGAGASSAFAAQAALGPFVLAEPLHVGVTKLGYDWSPSLADHSRVLSREFDFLVDPPRYAAEIQDEHALVAHVAEHIRRWCEIVTWQNQVDGSSGLADAQIADILANGFANGARGSADSARVGRLLQGALVERLIDQERLVRNDRLATHAEDINKTYHALTFADVRAFERRDPALHSAGARTLSRTANILRELVARLSREHFVPARMISTRAPSRGLRTYRQHLLRIGFEWTVLLDETSEDLGEAVDEFLRATTVTPADDQRTLVATHALGRQIRMSALAFARQTTTDASADAAIFDSVGRAIIDLLRHALERSVAADRTYHTLRADLMLNLTFDQEYLMERHRNGGLLAAIGKTEAKATQSDALVAWQTPRPDRVPELQVYADALEIMRAVTHHLRPPCERLLGAATPASPLLPGPDFI